MQTYRDYVLEIKNSLDSLPWQAIDEAVALIYGAWLKRKFVFIMGNGGSATTAQHMACDLTKNTASAGLPGLRAVSLSDNQALFSALANDNGYEHVYDEQLRTYASPGDVAIAISASGNSQNVLNGILAAREGGLTTIGISGYYGGKLAQMVDVPIVVPSHSIEQIEDVHLILEHIMTVTIRDIVHREAVQPA